MGDVKKNAQALRILLLKYLDYRCMLIPGVLAYICNPDTLEAELGKV